MKTPALRIFLAAVLSSTAPAAARAGTTPATVNDLHGRPVDPVYVQQFAGCDRTDTFNGVHFPITHRKGDKLITDWYGCSSDPSRLTRLERQDADATHPTWVLFVSKLGQDEDGSYAACSGKGGPTDQCGTSLMLHSTAAHPCLPPKNKDGSPAHVDRCVPVDPDVVPYVVIPASGPSGITNGEFGKRTGLAVGDYGVVLANGRRVPVIVADAGPAYKVGEGSTVLLKMLSESRKAKTFSSGVTFLMFPGSRDRPADLSPDTLAETVAKKGGGYAAKVLSP